MRLSGLYSDAAQLFGPVRFGNGLNAVIAEIRLPENRAKDTHNLGKTTLGRLLDFCLLQAKEPAFFLFRHRDRFDGLTFYLEVQLAPGSFLTVRRSVAAATKVSFRRHPAGGQDLSALPARAWDHFELPFDRAKKMLDGLLDWRALDPWPYRKVIGYLLRSQEDYSDVFQLRKFSAPHADWKPFLAHILGFNARPIEEHYKKEEELREKQATAAVITAELGGSVEDLSKIEGLLLLKQREAEKKQRLLDAFDFRSQDKERTTLVVEGLDGDIARLNAERYTLGYTRRKILESLEDGQILFSPSEARELFGEAGVLFDGQIKRDFEQLISFNRAITDERRGHLKEELASVEARLKDIGRDLARLGGDRSRALSFLGSTDPFDKYKRVSGDLVSLKADVEALERRRGSLSRLQRLRAELRGINEERERLQAQIEEDVERQNADEHSLFSAIRVFFSDIVEAVINRKALLSVSPNREGHLEFKAEILDEAGETTSADEGHTYRKLLCIAFDMALVRAHLEGKFPRFVFHDGVFESLDDRKKENLLAEIRAYAELGIQSIVTLIDSDLPKRAPGASPVFTQEEIALTLHDEGVGGRLFRMEPW